MSEKKKLSKSDTGTISRRRFIAGAGKAAFVFTIVSPGLVRGTEANSKINLGMIGCGGRGTWIANLFHKHGGYNIVAAADYFEDRLNTFGMKCQVAKANRYTGLSCYKKLLERDDIDAVAIESPPYFHPEQAAAAIDAGRHVYLAKPIAVDVPGCNSVVESGKKATANKLCFLVDFQTRANEFYREAVKRVQYGDIGRIFAGEASYLANRLGRQIDSSDAPEARLRNWVYDKAFSGDIITEQNIHALDVACWIIDKNPIGAYGTGGRKVRTDVGDCWDHFAAIFKFPDDIILSFNSKQCGRGYKDILCRVFGARGTIETHYGGQVTIRGSAPYPGGQTPNIYEEGAVTNIAEFYDNVTKGRFANTTVTPSVRSNLTTILGRTAAYRHGQATWDEIIKANEKIDGRLQGLNA